MSETDDNGCPSISQQLFRCDRYDAGLTPAWSCWGAVWASNLRRRHSKAQHLSNRELDKIFFYFLKTLRISATKECSPPLFCCDVKKYVLIYNIRNLKVIIFPRHLTVLKFTVVSAQLCGSSVISENKCRCIVKAQHAVNGTFLPTYTCNSNAQLSWYTDTNAQTHRQWHACATCSNGSSTVQRSNGPSQVLYMNKYLQERH